ncbi:MAG: helix-turn-helix domain-containing protein [Oscillospiraceae bacterium]|nr:helix-turn-helix domain-containing protein [Oscillospiraceae bacterium]
MANKVGPLIKEARTNARLSQTALAEQLGGVTAADIGKAERGEKELSQSVLRQIAKLTGVTQSSLLNAAKESTYTAAAKTTATAKTTAAKTTAAKTSAAKKTTAAAAKKTTTAAKSGVELTAAEKKLVELYRAADADTKKKAVSVLKGEATDGGDLLSTLLGSAIDMFGKK